MTKVMKLFIILLIPILIIVGAASFLATDQYLASEYGKSTFPPDSFGFNPQLRFVLASSNIHYVRAHLPSDELAKQTLNGAPLYNPREVSHMADVQAVFQSVMRVWQAAFILVILMGLILSHRAEREALASAIQWGGLLTATIVLIVALLGLFAWPLWFNMFHLFFFKPGSWLFSYSDTLIRLFPERFWFDTTLMISVLSLAGGLALALIGWQEKRVLAKNQV
jgi:integral membrane protein (TIGR01906 family)